MPLCLITGATGFVGSNLAARLAGRGWAVRCLRRSTSSVANLEGVAVEYVEGSLDDRASLAAAARGADAVFHLAGRVAAVRAEQFRRDNVEGTENVAAACAEQPRPPVLVYCSSLAAGGPSGGDRPRRESDADLPVSDYGRSKLEAERALAGFAPAVPITVVRPPIIFGPADRALLKVFRSVGLFRLHAVPGFRRFPVSLVHVADLCAGMELLAESGVRVPGAGQDGGNAGVYYIAAERWVSYNELGRLAARALGVRMLPVPTPLAAFWITSAVATGVSKISGRPSVLNLDKAREASARGWVCSDEKIRALGYREAEPLEVRFEETAHWYREKSWIK